MSSVHSYIRFKFRLKLQTNIECKMFLVCVLFLLFLNSFYLVNRKNTAEYGSQLSIIDGKQNYFFFEHFWPEHSYWVYALYNALYKNKPAKPRLGRFQEKWIVYSHSHFDGKFPLQTGLNGLELCTCTITDRAKTSLIIKDILIFYT